MIGNLGTAGIGIILAVAATSASADTVKWATLTSQPDSTTVIGNIGSVGVTYRGAISFSQLNNSGFDYWIDLGYTQGLVNRPTGSDLVALNAGGAKSITFSRPVSSVYVAFTSWNGNTALFDTPFTVISEGAGYWGSGAFTPNGTNTGFYTPNEVHGVLKFSGPITTLNFTDTNENWHGLTFGIGSVPEPSSWVMLIAGFGLVGATLRRRRTAVAQPANA